MFRLFVIPKYRENSASQRETYPVSGCFFFFFFLVAFPTPMNENSSGEILIGSDTTNTAVMEADFSDFSAGQSDDLTSCLNKISKLKVL